MKKTVVLMVISLFLLIVGPVYAVQIFSDDFNRAESDVVGNGWTEHENGSNDVAIRLDVNNNTSTGYLRLRDTTSGSPDAYVSRSLDLSLYTNVTISFQWRPLDESGSSDLLIIDWRDTTGSTWTQAYSAGLGGTESWITVSGQALPAGADIATFAIRLGTQVSESDEGANINYFTINGDLKRVPEPTTMLLLGLGLLGIGAVRRKK